MLADMTPEASSKADYAMVLQLLDDLALETAGRSLFLHLAPSSSSSSLLLSLRHLLSKPDRVLQLPMKTWIC